MRAAGRALRGTFGVERTLSPMAVGAYWWDELPNFGDALTVPLLLDAGIIAVHRRPQFAAVIGVGSLLRAVPRDYSGHVWGSGLPVEQRETFRRAHFLGVRGHLTREALQLKDTVTLGDPGLLFARNMPVRRTRWRIGLVAHFSHRSNPEVARILRWGPQVRLIDPRQPPGKVAAEISQCETIVTSSLHGLIFADAFGKPATWVALEPALPGGDFKFRDHESVVLASGSRKSAVLELRGIEAVGQAARRADPGLVEVAVESVRASRDQLRNDLRDHSMHVARAWYPGKETRFYSGPASGTLADSPPE